MRTRTREKIIQNQKTKDMFEKDVSYVFLGKGILISYLIGFLICLFSGFTTPFAISFYIYLGISSFIFGIPMLVVFLLKKENKKISTGLFWSFIFILYAFLAGILGGINPFLLGFFLLGGLMLPVGFFLVAGGILCDTLKFFTKIDFHQIIQTLKLKIGILFITFPFFYSGVSKLIGKEKTELSFIITSFVLLSFIFGWKYIKKYTLMFWEVIKEYLDRKRIKEVKKLSNTGNIFLENEASLKKNLKHSNHFISRERLKKGFRYEVYLKYLHSLVVSFVLGMIAGAYLAFGAGEAEYIKFIFATGFFFTCAILVVIFASFGKIQKDIALQLQHIYSLDSNPDSFYIINRDKIMFFKK